MTEVSEDQLSAVSGGKRELTNYEKDKLGEPYIRTTNPEHISKYGLE